MDIVYIIRAIKLIIFNCDNIYSPPNPSKQDAILRKIRGSRDQTIPGYLAPKSKYPGYEVVQSFVVVAGIENKLDFE